MNPGDAGSSIARDIWTALYPQLDEDEGYVFQLFTVARDQASAEAAFESYLEDEEGVEPDICAPDAICKIDFLPGETSLHMTARLHQLGYRFVLPRRSEIDDEEVARLTSALLRRTDIE